VAQILTTVAIVCFTLAAVSLVTSVIVFFTMKIGTVVGELSGKTATEAIARIRSQTTTQMHAGKSLQAIINEANRSDSLLSPENVEPALSDADVQAACEGETSLLGDSAEHKTSLLGDSDEPETSLLEGTDEQGTIFLGDFTEYKTNQMGDSAEYKTNLLGDSVESETGLLEEKGGQP
jgi:hypothetical protein